ncbi:NAC domain-containing protein 53-like [Cucurbita maxima]|uniref:NAC domain-containing protein 53-like n=1 Tax=Cucurbita maxima TaxID=3661 RepID=A0A6J1IAW9_CUCMA|nr:NAC domain-containing protein 53-like [Cucurbita maxima]
MADCIVLPSGDLLPVGFRFHPTDEELINHYLKNKMLGRESLVDYIRQVDICKYEPWDLPFLSNDHTSEQEWFFFAAQDLKYSNSRRSNRATKTGYWKSTGKDRKILAPRTKKLIGTKKTLVFYSGRVSNGIRTNWVIHEYHLHSDPQFAQLRPFVICLLKKKLDENDVLICDEAEQNGLMNLTFDNEHSYVQIPGNGQSLFPPNLQVSGYDFSQLESLLFCDREPISMDFQANNSYGTPVDRPTDEEIDIEEIYLHEGTPNSSTSGFNWKELLEKVDLDQGGALKGDTGMYATLNLQGNSTSHSMFDEHSSRVPTQTTPIIKESRRSPLTSKIFKYGGEEDLSSVRPRGDELQTNGISYLSDDSDRETITLRFQSQPRSDKVVNHAKDSQNVQWKRKSQLQVVSSPDKAKAVSKWKKVDGAAATSNKDIVVDRETEVKSRVAHQSNSTGRGSVESRGKRCSSILTTKCIHHRSSSASAYVARVCIGLILFFVVARDMLLDGNW